MNLEIGLFVQQDSQVTQRINSHDGPEFYLKLARLADELGYNSFWQPDHWMLPGNTATFDCWSLLAAVAAITSRIKLGSLVTPIVGYPPLVLSKRVLTVHALSKGRVILGVGAGWYQNEFNAFGVKFENHKARTEMLEEALRLMRVVWEAEEPVDYRGKYYKVRGAVLKPRFDRPPIWLGGSSEKILDLVARHGEGWIPYEIAAPEYSTRVVKINEMLERLGRKKDDVRMAVATRVVAGRTEEKAIEILRRMGIARDYETPTGQKGHLVAGSYEKCTEELSRYVDAGAGCLVLSPQPSDKSEKLLPVLKQDVLSKII